MVISRNISGPQGCSALIISQSKNDRALVYRDSASGPSFFHQEDQRNHAQDGDAQESKIVEIGQHGGFALNRTFNQGIGLLRGECRLSAMSTHCLSRALQHRSEGGAGGAEIAVKIV